MSRFGQLHMQWRMQGRGPPPLFLDQTGRPPLSQGLDDRPPPLHSPYLTVWISHCHLYSTVKQCIIRLVSFITCQDSQILNPKKIMKIKQN